MAKHFILIISYQQAAAAWALGQAGRHTPEHAKAVAQANVLPTLLQCYLLAGSSEDLQTKAKKALKNILQKCVHLPALEPLLHDAPPNILKHVVAQFSKVIHFYFVLYFCSTVVT